MTQVLRNLFPLGRRPWGFFVAMFLGLAIFSGLHLGFGSFQPVQAQIVRVDEAAATLYATFPDMPRENQYLSLEGNNVAENNTLLSRLLRYHVFVKKRSPVFRLDWQLTFADYLGANEPILIERYPGYNSLTVNPLPQDKVAIANLSMAQRRALVDKLFEIYNPQVVQTPEAPEPTLAPEPEPPQPQTPSLILPRPGAADLLAP
ncbi:MAG: hypothetical protein AAGG02_14440 [Cyanobacteria bacterium P01_H01_bin.15]